MNGLTILHLLPWLNFGGVEKYVIGLSAGLRQRGHRCIIVSSGGKLLPEAEAAGARHIAMPIHGAHGFAAVRKLVRIIDREHVDLLAAHNWTAGAVGFLAAAIARIPYVFTVHGVRDPIQRFFTYYWGRRVITVSAASSDQLINSFHLPRSRVVTSVIGVDADRFRPRPAAPALLHEFVLDAGAPRIVHVSRFSRGKAEVALRLIEAAPEIQKQAPGFQALIVGVGPLERHVAACADDANRALGRRAFVFAGPRADVPELLSLADVAVGTATVALEAMAAGVPVVAAGKAGFVGLVTPENLDAATATCFGDHTAPQAVTASNVAGATAEVLRDPSRRDELGRFGRNAILRSFSLRRAAESVERVYQEVLVGRRPVRRIAIFHLNQVGDLVFSLPALAALRARFPEAEITSILRPNLAELMQASPFVDRLVVRKPGLAGEARLLWELRRRKFDLAVAFSQSASTALQALATRAPTRIGFADADLGCLLNRKVHLPGLPWPGKLARLAVCLGAQAPPRSYVGLLRIPAPLRQRARHLLQQQGVGPDARIAVIAPCASGRRAHKAWDADKFAEVADYLHERWQASVVIVGGVGDTREAARIAGAMSAPSVNLAGETTTGELAAMVEGAAIVVGIDSGPMHLAAAMGAPVVALFGPTDPARTGPHGKGHEVVTAGLPCAPCAHPCEARECMSAITVEAVTAAVDRILGRAG
jgi:lipopolysaccharide heptosyltransferase II